jgi:hypothetical protein
MASGCRKARGLRTVGTNLATGSRPGTPRDAAQRPSR